MTSAASHPHLRLVGSLFEAEPHAREVAARRRDVAQENQAATHNLALSPTDPRWVVAVRAYSQLQGTTLTPERRRRVQHLAALLGVRAFEANIIMAIVQDHARHGRTLSEAAGTIALIERPAKRGNDSGWIAWRWAAALLVAMLAATAMALWLLR